MNASGNQELYSLMVLRTNEIDDVFPLPAHRAPGHSWFISRVESVSADDKPGTVWQQYHPNGSSVREDFYKFGSPTRMTRNVGADGKWGPKLRTIKGSNGEGDIWSVIRKSIVRAPAIGSDVFSASTVIDSTDGSLKQD
jgi:hypothetical protein